MFPLLFISIHIPIGSLCSIKISFGRDPASIGDRIPGEGESPKGDPVEFAPPFSPAKARADRIIEENAAMTEHYGVSWPSSGQSGSSY